jgi:myo-inositol-1(or 4)-monophosphatase
MTMNLLAGTCRAIYQAISGLPPEESGKVLMMGAGGDSTKVIDRVAEDAAVAHLQASGFQGTLLSEELGSRRFGSSKFPMVILDPVDGTTNAVKGIGFYSISLAASSGPRLSDVFAGVVLGLPTERIYEAELGKGSTVNGERIKVPSNLRLKDGLIGVDLNIKGDKRKLEEIIPLVLGAKHIRNMGSAALELCLVASGGLDLYFDNRGLLRVTDIAAACLVVREAGGLVLDMEGKPLDCALDMSSRISLLAGGEKICAEALALIKRK